MGSIKTAALSLIIAAAVSGCRDGACEPKMRIAFEQQSAVLAKPYPQWYKTVKNEVLVVMQPGQSLPVCDFKPAKDFAVYEVELSDGRVGYVEFDSAKITELRGDAKAADDSNAPSR